MSAGKSFGSNVELMAAMVGYFANLPDTLYKENSRKRKPPRKINLFWN